MNVYHALVLMVQHVLMDEMASVAFVCKVKNHFLEYTNDNFPRNDMITYIHQPSNLWRIWISASLTYLAKNDGCYGAACITSNDVITFITYRVPRSPLRNRR